MENETLKVKPVKMDTFTEQFLTFSITTTFFCNLIYMLGVTILKRSSVSADLFMYSSVIITGLIFFFSLYIFVKEKTKVIFYICFVFFYQVFLGVICIMFGKGKYLALLVPLSIIHFIVSVTFNKVFVMHNSFTSIWQDKNGKDLETFLYHNNVESQELAASIKKVKSAIYTMFFLYLLISFFTCKYGSNYPVLLIINTLIFIFSVFYFYYKICYFNNEALFANMGFGIFVKDKRNLFKYVCVIFLISFFAAGVCSRNGAFIKIKYKESERISRSYTTQNLTSNTIKVKPDEKIDLEDVLGDSQDNLILEIIVKIVSVVSASVIVVLLLVFLLRPLFSSGWKDFWKERKLGQYILKLFADIKAFFSFLKGKDIETYSTIQAKTFKNSISDYLKTSKKSREKKAELDRLTKQFMLLIDWGTKRNLLYKKSLAPAEYTALIRTYLEADEELKAYTKAAENCGSLFEKALYDKELLTTQEEKIYSDSIKELLNK